MEEHRMIFLPCRSLRQDPPSLCNTVLGIALDMGPAAFCYPVCNAIYIVGPLQQGSIETEGMGFTFFGIGRA